MEAYTFLPFASMHSPCAIVYEHSLCRKEKIQELKEKNIKLKSDKKEKKENRGRPPKKVTGTGKDILVPLYITFKTDSVVIYQCAS